MRTGLPEVHTYQSTRNVCSSSTRMPEAPAEDGECRRTSSAIDSFVLRFLAPGVRRTLGGLQSQRESGSVAATATSLFTKCNTNYRAFAAHLRQPERRTQDA